MGPGAVDVVPCASPEKWGVSVIKLTPAAAVLYLRSATLTDRGSRLVSGFVALLVVLHLAATFGPPTPSPKASAATALASYVLLAALAAWVERRAVAPQAR